MGVIKGSKEYYRIYGCPSACYKCGSSQGSKNRLCPDCWSKECKKNGDIKC